MFVKINKTQARKIYNSFKSIYLVPSNVYPDFTNMWVKPCEVGRTFHSEDSDFDELVGAYQFYNCNSELGRRVKYYTLEVELLCQS